MLELLEQGLAAQARNGTFAVKPDVFEFVLGHGMWRIRGFGLMRDRAREPSRL